MLRAALLVVVLTGIILGVVLVKNGTGLTSEANYPRQTVFGNLTKLTACLKNNICYQLNDNLSGKTLNLQTRKNIEAFAGKEVAVEGVNISRVDPPYFLVQSIKIVTKVPPVTANPSPVPPDWETGCAAESDCQLANKSWGFSCCWTGKCGLVDYSQPDWVAVNKNWYAGEQSKNCRSTDKCGPKPMCVTREPIGTQYTARCVNSMCVKTTPAAL